MSNDVKCPYCFVEQEICHDDGYGYEEDRLHEQQCNNCNRYYTFTTAISFSYESFKADCLNDGKHNYKSSTTIPKEFTMMECSTCDLSRKPTNEEMKIILNLIE